MLDTLIKDVAKRNVDMRLNSDGWTYMHAAVTVGNAICVKHLLKKYNANPNNTLNDACKCGPIFYSIRRYIVLEDEIGLEILKLFVLNSKDVLEYSIKRDGIELLTPELYLDQNITCLNPLQYLKLLCDYKNSDKFQKTWAWRKKHFSKTTTL